jgi:hypothetical protein
MKPRTWALLCAVLLLSSLALLGQTEGQTGQIIGRVQDQSGAAVPNAKVVITNLDTGATREVSTNEIGEYRAVLLQPGRYKVVASSAGLAPSTADNITVNVGTAVNVNFNLQVGAVAEAIQVTAPLVEVTRSEPGQVVGEKYIQNLPINGRRFQDFVSLTPSAVVEPTRGQNSILGQRGIYTSVNIDGADYNQPFFGGIRGGERSNFAPTVPQDAIGEFQVVTAAYSPEFGRSTGGVITAISKSGTNDFHGSAFYFLRHKELGVKDALNRQSLENRHQYGGSFGGPLKRDRAFIFAAAERQDQSFPRFVFFDRLTTTARTARNAEAYDFFKAQERPYTQTNDATTATGRFDYQFSGGHRLFLRYNHSRNDGENATSTGNNITPNVTNALSNNGTEQDRSHTFNAQVVSLLSPTLTNEFRGQYSKEIRPRLANSQTPNVTTTVGQFGAVSFLPTTQDDYRVQLADNLGWQKGAHSLKLGFETNIIHAGQVFGFNQFGRFTLSGSDANTHLEIIGAPAPAAGKTANRFDSTAVSYFRQLGNLTAELDMNETAAFFQDSWRVRPSLTVNYGLRWEGQYLPSPEANNTDVINLALVRYPLGGFDPRVKPDMSLQFMPRGGFAWDPKGNGRTVVRGHAGLFYAHTPLLSAAGPGNNFRNPAGDLSIQLPFTAPAGNPNNTVYRQLLLVGVDLNTTPLDRLPVIPVETIQRIPAALGIAARNPFQGAAPITWAPNFKNPRSAQWGFGVEHEFGPGFSVYMQYNYANTVHLMRNRDINLPTPVIRPTDRSLRPFFGLVTAGVQRPQPFFGAITLRESSARSLYRAATIGMKYNKRRIQFAAHWTMGFNYSDDDSERDATGFRFTDNGFNLRPEYFYSELDVRHTFVANTVVSLPWGIEWSAITRLRTAFPLNPATGADTNEDRGGTDRPYQGPGLVFPRNSFRNRSAYHFDTRVQKSFRAWSESSRIVFSAEMFNLFNFDNISIGGNNARYGVGVDTAGNQVAPLGTFRQVRLANGQVDPSNNVGTPFQFQAGLRLNF